MEAGIFAAAIKNFFRLADADPLTSPPTAWAGRRRTYVPFARLPAWLKLRAIAGWARWHLWRRWKP